MWAAAGVKGIQPPEYGHRFTVAALGHQELGTLREEHDTYAAQQAGDAAHAEEDLPGVDFWCGGNDEGG